MQFRILTSQVGTRQNLLDRDADTPTWRGHLCRQWFNLSVQNCSKMSHTILIPLGNCDSCHFLPAGCPQGICHHLDHPGPFWGFSDCWGNTLHWWGWNSVWRSWRSYDSHDLWTVPWQWLFTARKYGSVLALSVTLFVGPIAKPEAHLFSAESVCLCVSDGHVYPSSLTDFDETWSQGPYFDLVWPRP